MNLQVYSKTLHPEPLFMQTVVPQFGSMRRFPTQLHHRQTRKAWNLLLKGLGGSRFKSRGLTVQHQKQHQQM